MNNSRTYCESVGSSLPVDEVALCGDESPLARPYVYRDRTLANRFAILPMEGWDGTADGHPSGLDPPALAAIRQQRRQANMGR